MRRIRLALARAALYALVMTMALAATATTFDTTELLASLFALLAFWLIELARNGDNP